MKWEEFSIEDLCLRVTDGSHFSPKEVTDGYPMASSKDMLENDFDYYSMKKISETDYNNLVKGDCKPLKDDILIIKDGNSYLKYIFVVKEEKELVVLSSIAILRPNKELVNPLFFQSLLRAPQTKEAMANFVSGAAIPRIVLKDFKQMRVSIPCLPIQRKIASILSAYDDLIENNLKRIKLLEKKAFLRYKEIVRSEEIVSKNKLEDIIKTVKRKSKILKSDYKEAGEYPIIDQSTDFIGGYTDEKEAIYEDLPMIVFGDHTRILKYINFPFACGADGTQLVKPENPNISVAYLFFELISCNLSNYHYARHFKFLKEQVIKLPCEKVMQGYKEETDKIFNLIQVLRLQTTKLREARDILLPRLMSGEVEV